MLNFDKNKAIDVLLNAICIDIGENKLIEDIKVKRAEDIEHLFNNYEFAINHSPEDVKLIISEFNNILRELNELLSYSGFSIHPKALEELLEYAIMYKKDKAFSKTLDAIFTLVNDKRNNALRYVWLTEYKQNIGEVRIQNERWRLYFTGKDRKIVGFDYEHKTNDHRDMKSKLKNRLNK